MQTDRTECSVQSEWNIFFDSKIALNLGVDFDLSANEMCTLKQNLFSRFGGYIVTRYVKSIGIDVASIRILTKNRTRKVLFIKLKLSVISLSVNRSIPNSTC